MSGGEKEQKQLFLVWVLEVYLGIFYPSRIFLMWMEITTELFLLVSMVFKKEGGLGGYSKLTIFASFWHVETNFISV